MNHTTGQTNQLNTAPHSTERLWSVLIYWTIRHFYLKMNVFVAKQRQVVAYSLPMIPLSCPSIGTNTLSELRLRRDMTVTRNEPYNWPNQLNVEPHSTERLLWRVYWTIRYFCLKMNAFVAKQRQVVAYSLPIITSSCPSHSGLHTGLGCITGIQQCLQPEAWGFWWRNPSH